MSSCFRQRYVRELSKHYVYDLSILILLLISTNMMFKENNGNAIIVKWYANYEFQFDV